MSEHSYARHRGALRGYDVSYIVEKLGKTLAMPRSTNLRSGRQQWSALVVLLAVCCLTVNVATRYSSPATALPNRTSVSSSSQIATLQNRLIEHSRQRLQKTSIAWNPPLDRTISLEAPTFYPRIAPSGPPVAAVLLSESLYNRPPPSL